LFKFILAVLFIFKGYVELVELIIEELFMGLEVSILLKCLVAGSAKSNSGSKGSSFKVPLA